MMFMRFLGVFSLILVILFNFSNVCTFNVIFDMFLGAFSAHFYLNFMNNTHMHIKNEKHNYLTNIKCRFH